MWILVPRSVPAIHWTTSGTANLTQSGEPGPVGSATALPFLATDTAAQTAIRIAGAINTATAINVTATVVGDTVQLGTGATFNPGNSALVPQGNVPIFVADVDTPADVAERIAQAIQLSSLGGTVIPHFNNHPDLDANRINLEGAAEVQLSAGAAPHLFLEGSVGVDPANIAAKIHTGMSRDEVADVMDEVLETLFFNPRLIAEDGTLLRGRRTPSRWTTTSIHP